MIFGITEVALMFALGFGYIICSLAKKEDKGMQGLGHLIGISIMVLSSLFILVNVYVRFNPFASGAISRRPYFKMKAGMKPGMMREQPPMPVPGKK
jgi:hypothetical protein